MVLSAVVFLLVRFFAFHFLVRKNALLGAWHTRRAKRSVIICVLSGNMLPYMVSYFRWKVDPSMRFGQLIWLQTLMSE